MSSARSDTAMGAQLRMFPSTWRKTELMDEGVRPKVALRRAASLRYNLAATISSAWGGGGASLGDWKFCGGGCVWEFCARGGPKRRVKGRGDSAGRLRSARRRRKMCAPVRPAFVKKYGP